MKPTKSGLTLFVIVSITLSGCAPMTSGIETEAAICEAWADSLFLPSRADTEETAAGLNQQYQVQKAACG